MSSRLPPLVALPDEIEVTEPWPSLADAMGHSASVIGPTATRWLTVATAHISYFYEHSTDFRCVSIAALRLLEGTGKAVVGAEVCRYLAALRPNDTAGQRSADLAVMLALVKPDLLTALDLVDAARLGTGEERMARMALAEGRRVRTFESVLLQVLGWWSLVGLPASLGEFIAKACSQRVSELSRAAMGDLTGIFDHHFGRHAPRFEFSESGPDHNCWFDVQLTTSDGRRAEARGRSKKAARQAVIADYLKRYAAHLLEHPRKPERERAAQDRALARLLPPVTSRCAERIAEMFGCSDAGPFRQALVHRSWVREKLPGGDIDRDSNSSLGHLGSHLLNSTYFRLRTALLLSRSSSPDPEVARPLSLSEADLVPLAERLGLPRALALGVGQGRLPVSSEMAVTALQAIMAACGLQCDGVDEFESRLPGIVVDFLSEQATHALLDPVSAVQRIANALQLDITETFEGTGPDHARRYVCRLDVKSASGRTAATDGAATSKIQARRVAAAKVLDGAQTLTSTMVDGERTNLASLILESALHVLPRNRSRWPAWRSAGWLGAGHLQAADTAAFVAWSENACGLLVDHRPSDEIWLALADYYRLVDPHVPERPMFHAALDHVLAWVREGVDANESAVLDEHVWQELVGLSAAQSVRLKDRSVHTCIDAVIEDWLLLSRGGLEATLSGTRDFPVSARTGSAILRCLQEIAGFLDSSSVRPAVHVTITETDDALAVTISPHSMWTRSPVESVTLGLVVEAAPLLSIQPSDDDVQLMVARELEPTNWLSTAAFASSDINDVDEQLGRLLHDLKNEIGAARLALSTPAPTRTEQLEAALSARRHVNEAATLASRLVDADRLLSDADLLGETDLPAFLRSYSRDLLSTLPQNIRFLSPAPMSALVAIGERGLRTILDNLVKNATEALHYGGDIMVDYIVDDDDGNVMLEVTDTGPGIPDHVAAAIANFRAVPSTRKQGSGIGLLGVHRLIRRIGGWMEPIGKSPVKGWTLMIPLVASEPIGDELG